MLVMEWCVERRGSLEPVEAGIAGRVAERRHAATLHGALVKSAVWLRD
jgi:hypothetical protein